MKNINNNKGITLIALVITIIIMLILAGVGVVTLTGENGLLKRASGAGDVATESHEKELIQAEVRSSYSRKGDLDIGTVNTNIKNNINGVTTNDAADFPLVVTYSSTGNIYQIDSQGNVTAFVKVSLKVENSTLSGNSISGNEALKSMYGQDTDYKSVNGVTWQLFYDDTDNIYLIASDYVPASTLPSEICLEEGEPTQKYRAGFSPDTNATYTGPIMNNTPWCNGADSNTITSNPLTSKYLKWVNSNVVNARNNINMRAVAFMMDTSKWSNFAGSAAGSYAVGGPTIEIYALSYNAKHDTKIGTYETVNDENATDFGYMVKIDEGSWTIGYLGGLNIPDSMWAKIGKDKATGMWLATPSSHKATALRIINSTR